MRVTRPAFAAALAAALLAQTAEAQQRRATTQTDDREYQAYFAGAQEPVKPSPSDRLTDPFADDAPPEPASGQNGEAAAPAPLPYSTGAACANGCASACKPSCQSACCCEEEEEEEDCECGCEDCECGCQEDEGPWRLFGDIPLIPGAEADCCGHEPLGITIGGWVQGGITANGAGLRSVAGNFPVPFNQVSDGFIFNQAPWIYAEKAIDTEEKTFDWGFRVDYLFGTDAADTQAFGDRGWDFGWNSSRDYGSAIPQLYAEVAVADVSVKVGHFFTIIGYEVVPATGNFFYSHALTMNFGEPFTHTGILGKYTPDDTWTLYGGYTYGWDSGFENLGNAHTYLGGVTYAWEDYGTIALATNVGQFGDGGGLPQNGVAAAGDIYIHSLVASLNLTEELVYVFQHDYAANTNIPGAANAYWYGVNQYLFYQLTETIRAGGRFEWFDDPTGVRIGPANPAGAGAQGDYFDATLGVNWTPHSNFTLRPELRWDWFQGNAPAGALPYNNGTDADLFTFGVDGIVQF